MDDAFLEELSEAECWELVGVAGVARIAVNGTAGPHVVPINYVIQDGAVVFHSDLGTKVPRLGNGAMTFQVDQIDPLHRTGWSVLIRGSATSSRRAPNGDDVPESWTGQLNYLVRLVAVHVSGRRIRLPDVELDGRGYL